MKTTKNTTRIFVMALCFMAFLISNQVQAQIILPDNSLDIDDGTPAPIDTLIILGIAAGSALGLKKVNERKK